MAAASATGDSRANGAGSESPEKGSACPTCGEDLTGLKRVLVKLRREKIELKAKVHEFEPYRQVATGEVSTLVKEQRRAIKYLKKERRALREALGRTGAQEDIYRIMEIVRQSADRRSRERMDALVNRLGR